MADFSTVTFCDFLLATHRHSAKVRLTNHVTAEHTKRWAFVTLLAVIAIAINSGILGERYRRSVTFTAAPALTPVRPLQSLTMAQARPSPEEVAAQELEERRVKDKARYISKDFAPVPGANKIPVVVVANDGTQDDAVASALAAKIQDDNIEPVSDFFTPEFVSDGLFLSTYDGSREVFNRLDLAQSVSGLLLARENVRFTTNVSLNNVLTATLTLGVKAIRPSARGGTKGWTFVATGAGFKPEDAWSLAQERLLKQLAKDTNISMK